MSANPAKPRLPERIGRFKVEEMLGAGSQGVVLLAIDEDLTRQVAIKLLRPKSVTTNREQLALEARIVSQLQHPNIVTLHEVGVYKRLPFIVFEYVDGESLRSVLDRQGSLSLAESVILMSQILAGVAYAHDHGVVHRDLSPANILITKENNIPKVTDFGLSTWSRGPQKQASDIRGTLRYMSPEPFRNQGVGPDSDVFTLGAIFFEMLVGRRLMDGSTTSSIIRQILKGGIELPSSHRNDIDPQVDEVISRALQRNRDQRFRNAREMKLQLDRYRVPRGNTQENEATDHSTVQFLIRRMGHSIGFSALSRHISEVLALTSEDSKASAQRISSILSKDPTLTQRVLTAANSAFYGNGDITTITRAIVVLGLRHVRMSVTSALLDSHFESGSPRLRDALLQSFCAGVFAKEIARAARVKQREDIFTCAVFHQLGRTLTIHYFPEEHRAILDLVKNESIDELTASRRILGLPYFKLGTGVAREWKFPESIIQSMFPLSRGDAEKPSDVGALLQSYAAYANAVVETIGTQRCRSANAIVRDLSYRLRNVFQLDDDTISDAMITARGMTDKYARLIGAKSGESTFLAVLHAWEPNPSDAAELDPGATVQMRPEDNPAYKKTPDLVVVEAAKVAKGGDIDRPEPAGTPTVPEPENSDADSADEPTVRLGLKMPTI